MPYIENYKDRGWCRMNTDEHIFVSLCVVNVLGEEARLELVKAGFLNEDYTETAKTVEFTNHFYNQHKYRLIEAFQKYNGDTTLIMEQLGLSNFLSLLFLWDKLFLDK